MDMKIKVIKMSGKDEDDNKKINNVMSDMLKEGFEDITSKLVKKFTYDAYSAGGKQDPLEDVTVLIGTK
ncbi:hypothetical protein [Glaciecola sp. 1036]|uniref:hypothetical protein n=1 Tax=Alteromonadaceae TaxID=72275 RepID=UPI003D07BCE6